MKNKNLILTALALLLVIGGVYWLMQKEDKAVEEEKTEVIKIGAVLPLTGVAAEYASEARNGMIMAINEINKKGGVEGKKVELLIQDSKNDVKSGLDAYKKINANDDVMYFVSQISNISSKLKVETEKNNQYLISMIGLLGFTNNSNKSYRNFIAPRTIGKNVSKLISENSTSKKVGIIYPQTEYGLSIYNATKESLGDSYEIKSILYDEKNPNYRGIVTKMLNNKIECLFVSGIGKNIGNFIKVLKSSGFKGEIICDHTSNMPDVISTAGEAIKGVNYYSFPELSNSFIKAYKKEFNKNPTYFAGLGYNTIDFIINKSTGKENSLDYIYGNYNVVGKEFIYEFKSKRF